MTSRIGDKKVHNHCNLCKYFHLEVQEGGWLEICEITGGRVIGSDEYNKSDRCPFREDKNDK